jgi:arylsulfatase A-like enzyme
VVLVKPPGASSGLNVSDSPVSAIDVPATVLDALGVEGAHTGIPMGTLHDDHPRSRRYAAFDFTANKGDYVGPIVMYQVVGHSWDDDAWSVEDLYRPPMGSDLER